VRAEFTYTKFAFTCRVCRPPENSRKSLQNQLTFLIKHFLTENIAGDPDSDWTVEPLTHGQRINMGAYGGTA